MPEHSPTTMAAGPKARRCGEDEPRGAQHTPRPTETYARFDHGLAVPPTQAHCGATHQPTLGRPPRPVDALGRDREAGESIETCLETLPERQKDAFLIREVDGLETPEICNVLEVTATNLGVMLFRARNRLRECLESLGIERD